MKHLVADVFAVMTTAASAARYMNKQQFCCRYETEKECTMNKLLIASAVAMSVAFAGSALAQTPASAATPAASSVSGAPAVTTPAAKSTKAKTKHHSKSAAKHASLKTKTAAKA